MAGQQNYEIATLGNGCFWCSEAVYEEVKGILSVESGYSGGTVKNPSYREVCTGNTGHAEVVQIKFDPSEITYEKILEIFFNTHDPTTLNRQGADVGTQYRSVIFYHNQNQKIIAENCIKKLEESSKFKNPVVTEIDEFTVFYKAEEYHQDYFKKNPDAAYCSYVVKPKLDKFVKNYSDLLK
jgi:peptide-methionine (S)-S-oxide reductase